MRYRRDVMVLASVASVLAVLIVQPAWAQTPRFDPARISADVRELASDAYDGRAPGTDGERRTIRFLTDAFEEAGLQPAGDLQTNGQRGWTQAVALRRSDIDGAPRVLIHADAGHTWRLRQGADIAVRANVSGATQVRVEDAPLVFVGHGIDAPERGWNDFKNVDLTGKVAIVLISDPVPLGAQGDAVRRIMSQHGHSRAKYEQAARRGARGVMIIHDTDVVGYGWQPTADSNTNSMYDILRDRPQDVHPDLEAWIPMPTARALFARAGLDIDTLRERARSPDFTPVLLRGQRLSAQMRLRTDVIQSHNVAARLPGRTHPDETVLFSAHWDHIGSRVRADGSREIFHGAIDNAAGTAALLALARAFGQGEPLQRSLLFVAWTAEEKGLLGAEHYVQHPLAPLETTVGVVNMDVLSPHAPARDVGMLGSARLELLDALVSVAEDAGVAFAPDPQPEAGYFFRSDHFAFVRAGVPALTLRSGLDQRDGGREAGLATMVDYIRHHYHRESDQWRSEWPFTGIARDMGLLYTLGQRLGNSRSWPEWGTDEPAAELRARSAGRRQ